MASSLWISLNILYTEYLKYTLKRNNMEMSTFGQDLYIVCIVNIYIMDINACIILPNCAI